MTLSVFINPVGMSRQKMLEDNARRLELGEKVKKGEVLIRHRFGVAESLAIVDKANEFADDIAYWAIPRTSLTQLTCGLTSHELDEQLGK